MRIQELIGIAREYFMLVMVAIVFLGIVFVFGYFIVYKKLFKGKKRIRPQQLLIGGLLVGYVVMVIGVTFLNRGGSYPGRIDLTLFSSYKEAWYRFGVRHWQFVILNIVMFVPFGFLLPLWQKRFRRATFTIGAALLFTLSIETFQLLTGYGMFEADDLFNNLLGAVIGYGMVMGLLTVKSKGVKKLLIYFSPLLATCMAFGVIFTCYHFKEFGNLAIVPVHKADMRQAAISLEVKLNDKEIVMPVYNAPSYTNAEADNFVKRFFENLDLDTTNMEIIDYPEVGIYWLRSDRSHNIWFDYLDGSYQYTDFSSHDEGKEPIDTDEETLKENLTAFGIVIPGEAEFRKLDVGTYEWVMNMRETGDQLVNGSLTAVFYNDQTIKSIENHLVTYEKVRDVQMKSEKDAYNEVLVGGFLQAMDDRQIENVKIDHVETGYYLDSKGFYQPIYVFHGAVNGMERTIDIPGI
ncbi:VanZ family protein [Sporosarcina koreensis]|uniref:VanZ family protein n=1 Tax=Sporosarcina koreensis TaxID=334735 RepID=A0ABW0U341_9BACL